MQGVIMIVTTVMIMSCECFQEDIGTSQSVTEGSKIVTAKHQLWLRGTH